MLKSKRGFTLIELLIVIAIIAALATLFINNSSVSIKRGRDARRKSDVEQYQNALEIYATKNSNLFPSRTTGTDKASTTLCTDVGLSGCPEDPLNGSDATYTYYYESDGTGGGTLSGTKYVVWAKLEVAVNGVASNWIVCSNGLSGTKPQSGFTVAGGTCPLP